MTSCKDPAIAGSDGYIDTNCASDEYCGAIDTDNLLEGCLIKTGCFSDGLWGNPSATAAKFICKDGAK